jgi:hypothetical protein
MMIVLYRRWNSSRATRTHAAYDRSRAASIASATPCSCARRVPLFDSAAATLSHASGALANDAASRIGLPNSDSNCSRDHSMQCSSRCGKLRSVHIGMDSSGGSAESP